MAFHIWRPGMVLFSEDTPEQVVTPEMIAAGQQAEQALCAELAPTLTQDTIDEFIASRYTAIYLAMEAARAKSSD